jgi:hypothetical protein
MTFEQWAEQIKKGLCLQSEEKSKAPSCSDDRFDREIEEEESTYNLSQNS